MPWLGQVYLLGSIPNKSRLSAYILMWWYRHFEAGSQNCEPATISFAKYRVGHKDLRLFEGAL